MSGKVTRIRKDRTNQAKTGQFKNIVNAAATRKISLGNAQSMIKKLVKAKKSGGVIKANNGKSVKDGKILSRKEKNKIALDKAKKQINDKDYNVFSGKIQKNKNNQTNVKKNIKDAEIRKKERLDKNTKIVNTGRPNENKRVLKKGNFGEDILKVISASPLGFLRKNAVKQGGNLLGKVFKNIKTPKPTGGGQGGGKFNPPTVRPNRINKNNRSVVKRKPTELKKPNRSLINRPNQNRQKLSNPFPKIAADIALKGSLLPTPSLAEPNKVENKIKKPIKPNIPKVKKEKLKKMGPTKDYTGKFVNEKGDVAYDSIGDFFSNITGKAKKRARPENRKRIQADTKGATKGIGFSGKSVAEFKNPFKKKSGGPLKSVAKFNKGGKTVIRANNGLKPAPEGNKGKGVKMLPESVRNNMGFMRGGGKVVKMRGGGAATRGMNFNRGR